MELDSKASLDCDDPQTFKSAKPRPLMDLGEAIAIAKASTRPISHVEIVPLSKSYGRRLARSVQAGLDLPPFDQSAMDGYALAGPASSGRYKLVRNDVGLAGDDPSDLRRGQAARISTGARIPKGADRVVLQEHATLLDGRLIVPHEVTRPGANIRSFGEDVRLGDTILPRGHKVNARSIAMLAAQGLERIEVLKLPKVAVVSCGSELRQPGEALGGSELFDSNRQMLMALATEAGAHVIDAGCCTDNLQSLSALLSELSKNNDLVVVSGGTSVGEADLTSAALDDAGAEVRQLKIAMKPGKPALIGKLANATIVGLPGNPVAAFVSWQVLVRTMLAMLHGLQHDPLSGWEALVASELNRRPGRTEFVPASIVVQGDEKILKFIGPAGSGRLSPLCQADGFALVESHRGTVRVGEKVIFLPFRDGDVLQTW
ncbi:gephyrin-like molybdotransferase Glp [Rhizobium sp. NFACC06-2]|uniref:molybdopterin molybdotransferase MoeA n=1 Tax=Rhizobium sp. NFACC06-2 TaxID=1566264 RepID=UPI00165ED7E4|nr:gephyrin-like molybdotransferase Glp [Rhizobium sp. NFACC06-2]